MTYVYRVSIGQEVKATSLIEALRQAVPSLARVQAGEFPQTVETTINVTRIQCY